MIRLTFKGTGRVWVLEPDDQVTVGDVTFAVADIASVELVDVPFRIARGSAQTPEGPVEVAAFKWLDEAPPDDPPVEGAPPRSGVEVVWPLTPDGLAAVGDEIVAKGIRIARSIPEGTRAP